MSVKHLDSYLEEMEWRFNNRDNPYIFRDALRRIMRTEPLEYRRLIAWGAALRVLRQVRTMPPLYGHHGREPQSGYLLNKTAHHMGRGVAPQASGE